MTSPSDAVERPVAGPVAAPVTATRCPSCGSLARAGADWCSLCYADLRPVPPPRIASGPVRANSESSPHARAERPPGDGAAAPHVPCTVCGGLMRLDHETCPHCGGGMLDGLRDDAAPTLRLPLLGDLMRFGRGARGALAFGLSLAVVALLVWLLALLG